MRTADADVLILKYARRFHGADHEVAQILSDAVIPAPDMSPPVGEFRIVPTHRRIAASQALFVGVPALVNFRYREIREFSVNALKALAESTVPARSVALTLHGPGYGLDETECFLSEVAGITEAVTEGHCPAGLETVLIVERNARRAGRLTALLEGYLPGGEIERDAQRLQRRIGSERAETLREVGYNSDAKERIFVAMPFTEETGDLFHYGIQRAVNDSGYLCQRVDELPAVGDVLAKTKELIQGASFVVAELTGASPNVYLEVGYAWGCGVPTILLIQKKAFDTLKFNVAGQRCVVYQSIRDLEERLATELQGLAADTTR